MFTRWMLNTFLQEGHAVLDCFARADTMRPVLRDCESWQGASSDAPRGSFMSRFSPILLPHDLVSFLALGVFVLGRILQFTGSIPADILVVSVFSVLPILQEKRAQLKLRRVLQAFRFNPTVQKLFIQTAPIPQKLACRAGRTLEELLIIPFLTLFLLYRHIYSTQICLEFLIIVFNYAILNIISQPCRYILYIKDSLPTNSDSAVAIEFGFYFISLNSMVKLSSAGTGKKMWSCMVVALVWGSMSECVRGQEQRDEFTLARERDRVISLPGQPPNVEFAQYAGYVTVNASHGRALFYWFFEANSAESASKPLLLWLNGGPGCSSVGYGAAEEIGPFRVNSDGASVSFNKHAWNMETNVLFVESPAGVGFSYSNTTSDYENFGDAQTALDAYAFLVGWFERFPQYKTHDFYIAGESYAGHYVPQLAYLISQMNGASQSNIQIRLKGILIGNALVDDLLDMTGLVDYAWSHAVVSDSFYHNVSQACDFSTTNWSSECVSLLSSLFSQYRPINIYDIFSDVCVPSVLKTHRLKDLSMTSSRLGRSMSFKPEMDKKIPNGGAGEADPCLDNHVAMYLNRLDVQQALHANTTGVPYEWTGCSDQISSWDDSPITMLPILKDLMARGLRVWMFSGDTDGRIPVLSSRYSIGALKLPVLVSWYPWYHNNQVAGWSEVYANLTFASVRGAGHMVATYQPERAFALFSTFLKGGSLPALK
ncbi:hypothetical protein GOP47_0014636 [Adiantum capillus-veneris]|uniref:Carboxypeptidase n=1 Tax=Adiantum capillus-veneris TaxID=13818 RepID=A0A9D4UN13_ADICA|nr:hypothetical protein GOP47_0014636 [Adiantum capillus-veneris]